MSETEDNLLLRLHKWAKRQDENFHTEALAHLLRHLTQHEPIAATNLLKVITGELLDLAPNEVASVSIETQVTTPSGTPDIEIKTLDHLIYVEVKVESGLGNLQLERYRQVLKGRRDFKNTSLVLLTRYPFYLEEDQAQPDVAICWYQIAERLKYEFDYGTIQQPVGRYVTEQFLRFLQKRGLTVELERVGEELTQGVQAFLSLRNLLEMVRQALILNKVSSIELDAQWDWIGYFFKVSRKEYSIGIEYDRPYILVFSAHNVDRNLYKHDELEYIEDGDWFRKIDLSSALFFQSSSYDQWQYIKQFFDESLNLVQVRQSNSIG
ncbi:MAG: PD-(D/E)XK nuclease family protein [Chloroflexi bacterium]|nr:PD-(D/E)XK nuclease family protein [Chloroflexota bacterium]